MSKITILRGTGNYVQKAMKFIGSNWKENHILSVSEELFTWQYYAYGKWQYFLAVDEDDTVCGFYGMVLYNGTQHPDVSGNMWKVVKTDNPMLGVELQKYAADTVGARYRGCLGLNKKAVRLEKLLGGNVVQMSHFYRLRDLEQYSIAEVKDKVIRPVSGEALEEIKNYEEFCHVVSESELKKKTPYKDSEYYRHRFFEHPVYSYLIYRIKKTNSVLVFRLIRLKDRCCLRVTDYIGEDEDLVLAGAGIDDLMERYDCEYTEFYEIGIDAKILREAGFELRDEKTKNILPHYFEPFERVNVELTAGGIAVDEYHMYVADSDQDRPNYKSSDLSPC